MTIAFRTQMLTTAMILAGVGAVPASAQLLSGQGGGAIGAAANLEGTLSGNGNLNADRIGTAAGRIANKVEGSASTSSRQSVNTRSGHVAADTALDGTVNHTTGASIGNGRALGGTASSTGSAGANAAVGVDADLVGTDQVARTGRALRRAATGATGQAQATARGAAAASRNAAARTAGFAHRHAVNAVGAARHHAGAAFDHGRRAAGATDASASGALAGSTTGGSLGLDGSASMNGSGSVDAGTPRR